MIKKTRFNKILIANRGEIACRVIKTAKKLGIKTVAVYSDIDRHALHVQMADEAICVGTAAAADSYLRGQRIIAAAQQTGAQAIHPGYGFLSENADFCRQCAEADIVFIGPSVEAIEVMGSKSASKALVERIGLPLLSGYHGDDQDPETLRKEAEKAGYPVLLKASAGGGGKGMRVVETAEQFDQALAAAKREAMASFADDKILVEKYLENPRHVEMQVFFDQHGNGVHLFERDCSIQRRHQKIIEEAPAPGVDAALREKISQAALQLGHEIAYVGAGTVEFLMDDSGGFYFMEMNTRLQVEHPVTELITGFDLVEWQLLVAAGETLPVTQDQIILRGHAMEARLYAEDPRNEFLPQTGDIRALSLPEQSDSVRVDIGVQAGDSISPNYDPMIAKVCSHGKDRQEATLKLIQALEDTQLLGTTTNLPALLNALKLEAFQAVELSTKFVDQHLDAICCEAKPRLSNSALETIASGLWAMKDKQGHALSGDIWQQLHAWRVNASAARTFKVNKHGQHSDQYSEVNLDIEVLSECHIEFNSGTEPAQQKVRLQDTLKAVSVEMNGELFDLPYFFDNETEGEKPISFWIDGEAHTFSQHVTHYGQDTSGAQEGDITAPMTGNIVSINVGDGASVQKGDVLIVLEAMKMEHSLCAPQDGIVEQILCQENNVVEGGSTLLRFEA